MARKSNTSINTPSSHVQSGATPVSSARKRKFNGKGIVLDWDSFEGFDLMPARPTKRRKQQDAGASSTTPIFKGTALTDRSFQLVAKSEKYWNDMVRYRKCTILGQKFKTGDIVNVKPAEQQEGAEKAHIEGWVAKVLEIRASSDKHVFLRVFWLYRPEDLPGGRRPYHACNELIASNDMDIIEATTIDGVADVMHWVESPGDSEILDPDQLFWRQSLDITKPKAAQLSQLPLHCIDEQPTNPKHVLIQCESCKEWLHGPCLEMAALRKVYGEKQIEMTETGLFEAEVAIAPGVKPCVTINCKPPRPKAKAKAKAMGPESWTIPIHCLICDAVIEEVDESAESNQIEGRTPSTPANKDDDEEEGGDSVLGEEMSSPAELAPRAVDNPLAPAASDANKASKRKGPSRYTSRKRQKAADAAAGKVATTSTEAVQVSEENQQKSASQSTPPPPQSPEPGLLQSGFRKFTKSFMKF